MMAIDFQSLVAGLPVADDDEIARREAEYAERERRQRRSQMFETIRGVPLKRELAVSVVDGTLTNTVALQAVRSWLDALADPKGKPTIMLLGGPGSGKTTAAAWAITQRCHSGDTPYRKMRDVAAACRASWGDEAADWHRTVSAGFLVVDELTTERDADHGRAALHELIDERQPRMRPTILIANRTKGEIAAHYDARTIDRLREGAVVVELAGKSMRKGAW